MLSNGTPIQPPNARLSRGLEVHPHGAGEELELWIDPSYIRAGYAWSFPATDELRVGVGSFWPSHHVKEPTVRLAGDLGLPPHGYQGNWIPHRLRTAVEDGVFFVGDSAGHCLPLTAEGIRTALYFGLACARELAPVLAGHATREQALGRYGAFSDAHERKYRWLLNTQRAVGQLTPSRAITVMARTLASERVCHLGVQPLPGDRPTVVCGCETTPNRRAGAYPGDGHRLSPHRLRALHRDAISPNACANRRMPSSIAGSARLA